MSRRSKALRYYRSSKPLGPIKKFLRSLTKIIIILFLLYHVLFLFFLRSYRLNSAVMEPRFSIGERLIATPLLFGPTVPPFSSRFPAIRAPRRGDIVIVKREVVKTPLHIKTIDTVVRFFTLQKFSLAKSRQTVLLPAVQVKRVIGLPGDLVKMENYRVKILRPEKRDFVDEEELLESEYEISMPEVPSGENTVFPFSGDMPAFELDDNEYLVLSDYRGLTDSARCWAATKMDELHALVLFSFEGPF
jgi:signal peptidase I